MSNYFAHETAVIDPDCHIGEGTKIWHFSHLMAGCVLRESIEICRAQNRLNEV